MRLMWQPERLCPAFKLSGGQEQKQKPEHVDTALAYTFPISYIFIYKALICVAVLCYKNVNSYTYIASEESVWDTSWVGYIFE